MSTKNIKLFIVSLVSMILLVQTAACAPVAGEIKPTETAAPAVSEVNLINPLGPTVIPVAGLSTGDVTGNVKINLQYWKTVDEAVGLLSGQDVQFAVLPITTGANMVASGVDMSLVGVHEWKVFYLVAAENSSFDGWKSLVGKTIYAPEGKGQTVDVLTRYALSKENITPDKDVKFVYAPAQEIIALFKEGKIEYAALPEPFVTQAVSAAKGKIVLDYQEYWSGLNDAKNGIPIAGIFVKNDFLKAHPVETKEVVETLSKSIQWSNENTDAAIEASTKVLPLPAKVMQAAMQRIKFEYVSAADSKQEVLTFLKTIQETYPEGVKKMPDDSFFK
ncbi:MAG: ABC transporter substrate-binding protein [Anaerolineae bacterium]|nr:ABC transporter substrate-binding protein [Anaerolineae bacterium]